ncbi:MAG: hypothetical protein ACI9MR_001723, partial [Myxococcota bacterium]
MNIASITAPRHALKVLLVVGLTLTTAGAALAEDATNRQYRYKLVAMGQGAGEAVLNIGAPAMVDGKPLRAIRIDAKTGGLAAKFVNTATTSTTWVNERWQPVAARWDSDKSNYKQILKTKFDGRKINATDERDGKLHRKISYKTKEAGVDLISVFPWLMAQDMTPGTKYTVELFDGNRVYRVDIEVGKAKEIHVPIGMRKAIPLRATISRGSYSRKMTAYFSADKDRAPLKLVFKYGLIGKVEALLVSHRK